MALKRRTPFSSKGNGGGDYERLEPGEYEARLVYVADLGLQDRSFRDEHKEPAQQIALGFEVLGHPVKIDGVEQPRVLWLKPFYVYQEAHEKSNEYKYYKVFDPAFSGGTPDWEKVLGTPCTLVVGRKKLKDKEVDEIIEVQPIPKKYWKNVPEGELTPAVGDADDPENPAQKALHGLARWKWEHRIKEESEMPF